MYMQRKVLFLAHLSRLPHLPRAPHLHVKRPLVTVYSETSIKRTPIKRTPSIKPTLSRVPKLMSYISLCTRAPIQRTPLLRGRGH